MPKRKRANASKSCLVSAARASSRVPSLSLATEQLYRITTFSQTPADALSDHEQRVLEEVGAHFRGRSRVIAACCMNVALLLAGVAAAAPAIAVATATGA